MYCKHCGEKTNYEFCCNGCRVAYMIINSLDLQKYYEFCKVIYNKKPMKIYEIENELDYVSHIVFRDSVFRINLIVEGIYCGSCVWLIENTLKKQAGVTSARLNLSTGRLVLEWLGKEEDINQFVQIINKMGYKLIPFTPDAAAMDNRNKEQELLKCMFISGFASVAIMMITFGIWAANFNDGITPYFRDILHWVATLITVPAIIYSGRPFFLSAIKAIKSRRSNMDVPISIATFMAVFISLQELLRGNDYIYLDAAISLVFFLLIGRYLDLKMRNRARDYAQNMIFSQAQSLTIDRDGILKLTSIKNACEGDIAFVAVGEMIPVDGIVVQGQSEVDNSIITGETMPVAIKEKSFVHAGTVNLGQPIRVKITKLGENTTLSEIIKLMEVAEQNKAKFVRIADKISSVYTPAVLILSLATMLFWLAMGSVWADALLYAISVMIITCPCALGLSVPIAQVIATGTLIKKGIIVKTGDAFERLAETNYFVFDKTGTLTEGKPTLVNPEDINDQQKQIISAIAAQSRHPLCQGIVNQFDISSNSIVVREIKGYGVEAEIDGKLYKLGNREFCNLTDVRSYNDEFSELWFTGGDSPPIRLKFKDKLKSDAIDLIRWIRFTGMEVELLSGDRKNVVSTIAKELGVNIWHAENKPKDKYTRIENLQKEGKKVLAVGDGLNDSAALALAHSSMSPASALEISQTSADIVFQGNKLLPIKEAFLVARKLVTIVKQNFFISLSYNLVTIPFAMLGYATPVMAAIIMSTSSLLVVANAMRIILDSPRNAI